MHRFHLKILYKYWSQKDSILFFEQLQLYIDAGFNVFEALNIVRLNYSHNKQATINTLVNKIKSGVSLPLCLKDFINDSSVIAIVEQGYITGSLSDSFKNICKLLSKRQSIKTKLLSSLIYPAIIGLASLLMIFGLVNGVIPQISPILKGLNIKLPLATQMVVFISDYFVKYWLFTSISTFIFLCLSILIYKKNYRFRFGIQQILLKVPIIGQILVSYSLSVFLYSFGSMVDSGLFIQRSYQQSLASLNVLPIKREFEFSKDVLNSGVSISDIFKTLSYKIPKHIAPMLIAGEMTGTLGSSCIKCAEIIDYKVDILVKRLTTMIEPVMMLGMGATVGFIAVSIVMPIYSISSSIHI
jgi:type IV pilus assembly protein PilC